MWDVKACRGCLTVKCKLEKIGEASKRLYTVLTGLQITDGDGYPNYFCVECRAQLRKCLAFRRKSRRAHFVLKEIMTVRKQVTYSDIITVNRRKTNLESPLKFWDPQRTTSCFIINADEQDSLTELKPNALTYGSNFTHVIDIKPEIVKTEDVETLVDYIKNIDDDNFIPDQIDDEVKEEEPAPADIDLNDIFKDLNNENDNLSENEDTQETNNDNDAMGGQELKNDLDKQLSLNTTISALAVCKIRVLSLDEQLKKIKFRQMQDPFYHAQYKCSMCFTTYKTMEQLVEHVNFHNERRFAHECQVCKNKFETVEELNLHIARAHMYEYKCKCQAVFYSMYDVVNHHKQCGPKRAHKKNTLTWLKMFTKAPLTGEMLAEMIADGNREEHRPLAPTDVRCDVCGAWFVSLTALVTHSSLSHKFSYSCKECNEVILHRTLARKHAHTHLRNKRWPCKICGMKYKSIIGLKTHRAKKHSMHIPCNLCGRQYPTRTSLYKHQLTEHKYISLNDPLVGDPQHKCTDCEVQFVDHAALAVHLVMAGHAGAADVEFSCVPCKKIYKNREELETHLITCKQPVKYPRKCCYCEELLLDKSHYKSHYIRVHPTLQYRYASLSTICETCGKSIFKPNLEAHLKSHLETAYECRCCGASNLDPTVHVNHVLSQHAARPYCCTLCARRFQHRSDCRDHILKVHAPAKLYRCEFCGLEFSYFRRLREHSEKLHNLVLPIIRNAKATKLKIFVYAHMIIEINLLEKEAVAKSDVELLDYLGQKSKSVNYEKFFKFNSEPDEYVIVKKRKRVKKPKMSQAKIKIESDILLKAKDEGGVTDFKAKVKNEPVVAKVDVEYLGTEVEMAVKEIQPKMEDVVEEMVEEPFEEFEEPVEQVVFGQEPVEEMVFGQEPVEEMVFDQEPVEQMVFDQEPVEQVLSDQESVERVVSEHESLEQVVSDQELVEQVVSNQESVHQVTFDQDVHPVVLEQETVEPDKQAENAPLEVFEMDGHQYVMIGGEMYKIAGDDDE